MKRLIPILLLIFLTGCGGATNTPMMASPALFQEANIDPYASYSASQRSNKLDVFYVTTRQRTGGALVRYSNDPGKSTKYGIATILMGGEDYSFDRVRATSLGTQKRGNLNASIDDIVEFGSKSSSGQDAFIEQVNTSLDRLQKKEILIYVHGFNTGFLEAITRIGQIEHLMGQQMVGLAYCWPCGQSPFVYHTDVQKGLRDSENLANLLKLLAEKTSVTKIHLMGYSAGAPLLSKGLYDRSVQLANESDPLASSRLGVAMFMSADIDLKTFGEQEVKSFYRICSRVVVTVCKNDWALKLASAVNWNKRLGGEWASGLTREQLAEMDNAHRIEFVDLDYSDGKRPHEFDGHFFWYSNPWGVSDLLLAIQYGLPAQERGLAQKPGGGFWYFPADYPSRLRTLPLANQDR